jgi:hypothetical protein
MSVIRRKHFLYCEHVSPKYVCIFQDKLVWMQILILLSSFAWSLDAVLTFLSPEIPFCQFQPRHTKKSCICRELNSQAEQADSLIDSIIQVLDIQYTVYS